MPRKSSIMKPPHSDQEASAHCGVTTLIPVSIGRMVYLGFRENLPMKWRFCGSMMFATVTALLVSSMAVFILFSRNNSFFNGVSILGSTTNTRRHHHGGNNTKTNLYLGFSPEDWRESTLPWLFKTLEENSTRDCDNEITTRAQLFGLPRPSAKAPVSLATNAVHELLLVSYTETGVRRCSGGDFYETDITVKLRSLKIHLRASSGPHWKSRPPVLDMGDGSYLIKLHVDSRFAGLYDFKATLLFASYHGLDHETSEWKQIKLLISLQVQFVVTGTPAAAIGPMSMDMPKCSAQDFKLRSWSGRWTQLRGNEICNANHQGRYLCLNLTEQCVAPWCRGPLGILESNGWVYSAHCSFQLYTRGDAWRCLAGKWLFSWGDSNHQDTIYNLLSYVVGIPNVETPRVFHKVFLNPQNSSQNVTITQVFNGHYDVAGNYLGMASLHNVEYKQRIISLFYDNSTNYSRSPDAIVLNSGLHDGLYNYPYLTNFSDTAKSTASFWDSVISLRTNKAKEPTMVYRTTVAPAGFVRGSNSNPQKMDIYNRIMVDAFLHRFPGAQIVDSFDMTFPFHYDNNYSDGGHYGRTVCGRHYFVDFMLVHTILNAICSLI